MPMPGQRERVSSFRLRIEQGNKLPFDNINPRTGGVAEFH